MKQTSKIQGVRSFFAAFLLVFIGQLIGGVIVGVPVGTYASSLITDASLYNDYDAMQAAMEEALPPLLLYAEVYLPFLGIWIVGLLWMLWKNNRPVYKVLGTTMKGNTLPLLGLGLLVGFGANAICVLVAVLHGDIQLTFSGFDPGSILLIFLMVLIQAGAEEFICRGYLYQKLLHHCQSVNVAIIGNVLFFTILHLGNDGITFIALVNVALSGIFLSFLVYYFDSFWAAVAFHTAWNFTQNILFGLPNSGLESFDSVFVLNNNTAQSSFAYDTYFGIEGTIVATFFLLLLCLSLHTWKRTETVQHGIIWPEDGDLS